MRNGPHIEPDRAREEVRKGRFSRSLAEGVALAVAGGVQDPEIILRALAERIVDAKGYFGLHEDADSQLFFDALYLMDRLTSAVSAPTEAAEFGDRVTALLGDGDASSDVPEVPVKFRLTYGLCQQFVDEWWKSRTGADGRIQIDRDVVSTGLGSAVDIRYDRLLRNLDRGIELYHRFRVTPWEQWLRKARAEIAAGDANGLTYMLQAYGGMGSINDLYITALNGDPTTEAEGQPVTQLHDEIIEAISVDTRALVRYYREERWTGGSAVDGSRRSRGPGPHRTRGRPTDAPR